jgi:hypothetical protein
LNPSEYMDKLPKKDEKPKDPKKKPLKRVSKGGFLPPPNPGTPIDPKILGQEAPQKTGEKMQCFSHGSCSSTSM